MKKWEKLPENLKKKKCLVCNKIFIKKSYESNKKWLIYKFCSKKCSGKSLEHREKLSKSHLGKKGINSSNWQGGLTSFNKLERARFKNEMQKLVFERDNYTCQICGSKKDLQVDHIQSWADYVELRFSINNCRTLCMGCHYLITFGKPMPKNIRNWGHFK